MLTKKVLNFNPQEILTAFMVLFAVIDIIGSTPIIMSLNSIGGKVQARKASLVSLAILVVFLFAGGALLKLFNTDIASFAIAGALVLFALAIEMTFNIELFRNDGTSGQSTIIPVVFPLVAGPGTLTTALSLRAECSVENIIVAIILNMIIVYIVIRKVNLVERLIGRNGIYILRRFFGVILLAMSVKLFVSNLRILLA
ncbi:MAG: MarC family protein [Prevotellaceae bacterium]|jgi:multiple antibiotic resistance protein|nr:MarC family protein [Prevotellaceae bacterium]